MVAKSKQVLHLEPYLLDAVDDFLERGHVGLKRKPLNLVRRWKMRRKYHYWPLLERLFSK